MASDILSYLLLFASAFLAATILPFYSEIYFFKLLTDGLSPVALWSVATIGNTLGSLANWLLGLYILHFRHRKWFYFRDEQIDRAQRWFNRYGVWTLLLAWAPVGGDPLTLVAGIMKVPLGRFLVLVAIGKGARYLAVMALQHPLGFA